MTPAAHFAPASACAPPRLARHGARRDALTPLQRRAMVGVIVAAHGVLAYGLMQVRELRGAIAGVAPVFVSMVTPAPKAAPPPVTPPAPRMAPPAAKRVITAEPTPPPSPAPFTAAAPPPEPVSTAAAAQAGPAPTAPPPRLIPASAVRYLEAPVLVYPRASRRAGEAGHVVLRVLIDEAGLPRQVLVNQSSGFARLDEAATTAVQKARFKPYSDNGQALAAWALVPLSFDLEK
jgi:protein TonB